MTTPIVVGIVAGVLGLVVGFNLGCLFIGFIRRDRGAPRKAARPAADWLDPDNAPPSLGDPAPHRFEPSPNLPCCAFCGGGRNHAIHSVFASE